MSRVTTKISCLRESHFSVTREPDRRLPMLASWTATWGAGLTTASTIGMSSLTRRRDVMSRRTKMLGKSRQEIARLSLRRALWLVGRQEKREGSRRGRSEVSQHSVVVINTVPCPHSSFVQETLWLLTRPNKYPHEQTLTKKKAVLGTGRESTYCTSIWTSRSQLLHSFDWK